MMLADERVELHFDHAFARFKQSCADVTRTIRTTRLSFSEPPTNPFEPPKDISALPRERIRAQLLNRDFPNSVR
jgi:hypothetical protein